MIKTIFTILLCLGSAGAYAETEEGTDEGYVLRYPSVAITQLKGEGLNDPFNSIYIDFEIEHSPCSSTNEVNRFAISDHVHQTFALAALLANKKVTIQTTGLCNSKNIETINNIVIKSSE